MQGPVELPLGDRDIAVCLVSPSEAMGQLLSDVQNTDVGGAEVQLARIAKLLSHRGWTVSCVVADGEGVAETVGPEGVRLIPSYRSGGGVGRLRWLTYKWPALWRAMQRADADIYISRGANWLAGAVALFARLHGRSSVFWSASDADARGLGPGSHLPQHVRTCYRFGVRHSDLLITQTETQSAAMRHATGRDCRVIPNVYVQPNGQATLTDVTPIDVLWVGNIRPRKRPDMVLDVAERLPELEFTMVGGAISGCEALYDRIRRRAAELGNVSCVGHVPHGDVHAYYEAATVLLHTSQVEGFPNVLLEAWGHGLPVVSTFDPDGVIGRHQLGHVVATVEGLAEAVGRLTGEPSSLARMGRRAQQYLERFHDPEVVATELERALMLMHQARRGRRGR